MQCKKLLTILSLYCLLYDGVAVEKNFKLTWPNIYIGLLQQYDLVDINQPDGP